MAVINGTVVGAEAGFYPKEIEQSLRFNDDDSAYLSWTPSTAGNTKVHTFSSWMKFGNIGTDKGVLGAQNGSTQRQVLYFTDFHKLQFYTNVGGTIRQITTDQVFRDVSSWYHIVVSVDTTQATDTDRVKIYINGELAPVTGSYPNQNAGLQWSNSTLHYLGAFDNGNAKIDGYLAETHFIDGTAYDATAFGEFKNGVWIPKTPDVTYGTNGFYLPYRNDYTVEGFSATTYTGNGGTQYIGGVGFEPDLVWIKDRDDGTENHWLYDSVRGATIGLSSNLTDGEYTLSTALTSFETDGFTVGVDGKSNRNGDGYVAWCWDAGTGSPVSNTDGSITSTVKANPSRGFSIVSYTGTGSAGATVGHGLSSAPELMIFKNRDTTNPWIVYAEPLGNTGYLQLASTAASGTSTPFLNSTDPTSSVFTLGTLSWTNTNNEDIIAYCFHSVAGYSKMGSYTGTGASGNKITTGFKPAFVLTKMTSSAGEWRIHDSTRSATDPRNDILYANQSAAELVDNPIDFDDDGFTLQHGLAQENGSGSTYIYMAFADTREAAFWLDDSGNNNDWENNGLTESDISLDSPTNNFATLNPLEPNGTFREGNLYNETGSSQTVATRSTIAVDSGKWYWEVMAGSAEYDTFIVGVSNSAKFGTDATWVGTGGYCYYGNDGNKVNNLISQAYGSAYTSGDVVGIALDMNSGTVTFYKNNVSQGVAYSGLSGYMTPYLGSASTFTPSHYINFGQDSSFAGNKVAQGYTDANGRGDFYYAPPAGYLALCTANLPEPAIGPNSASTSDEHFNTVLYTGNASTNSIDVGFATDFLWIKRRDSAYAHNVYDIIRGDKKNLLTNATDAEFDASAYGAPTLESNGFEVTDGDAYWNASGGSYVAWNWKANGFGVTNTDGSITSTVSANVDAGFSIVGYTGNGSAGATVGHGLSQAPDMMIVKNRDAAQGWGVYHQGISSDPETDRLLLNSTNAAVDQLQFWQDTAPTSSVFTIGNDDVVNGNGNAMIAYCFHSVEGYSKFGSYTGNGSTDGTFVYTGFRPAFVIAKSASGADNWRMYDNKRDGYNSSHGSLYPNLSAAEDASGPHIDMLSNGFKWRTDNNNNNGVTFIYMAFAENPFKYSNAR